MEAWNTKGTERLSKLTAKKEAVRQKLAGISELQLQKYYDRQAKMKQRKEKWLAKWRVMSKLNKEL